MMRGIYAYVIGCTLGDLDRDYMQGYNVLE